MLAGGRISPVLKQILVNPRILKVGVVSTDLEYLQEACQSADPFVGAVDLAQFAKERLVISSANIGLVDRCAKCFHKFPFQLLGIYVLLFSEDRTRLIRRGTIKSLEGTYATRVKITRTLCVFEVTEVIVSGAIVKIGNQ
ncbi:hypothetical protein B0H14DRAFT_2643537 [Mycena olivaceomarginata]|nr:hypothetical protein B0H14DRAFT_2643537 [Mycena olivaceomarginata]